MTYNIVWDEGVKVLGLITIHTAENVFDHRDDDGAAGELSYEEGVVAKAGFIEV